MREVAGEVRTGLRADARDNRARILTVARAVFAAEGLDVPIREIARRSEVGVATVYRHFPTKEALLAEAFAEQMASCVEIVEEGLADADPWRGFGVVVERLMAVHALDRGLARAFTSPLGAVELAAERDRALRLLRELVRRAKDAGELRDDFVVEDLVLVLMANEGIRAVTLATRVAAARRFAALVTQSFRAGPTVAPLPSPVVLPLSAG